MKKFIALLGFILTILVTAKGQPAPSVPEIDYANDEIYKDIAPASPDVASLGQYCDIPVNEFNGLANISVPLYTIDFDGLKIPLSISYHSIGIKVNQEASRVGLGWTLNAGGVITQNINRNDDLAADGWTRGLDEIIFPIFEFNGYNNEGPQYSGNVNSYAEYNMTEYDYLGFIGDIDCNGTATVQQAMLDEAAFPDIDPWKIATQNSSNSYIYDTQPDIFNFNFLNYTGKFVLDRDGNAHTLNDDPITFTYNSASERWIAQTLDGFKFIFSLEETTELDENNVLQNKSFFLREIISPYSTKTVEYQYLKSANFNTCQFSHNVAYTLANHNTVYYTWHYCNSDYSKDNFAPITTEITHRTKLLSAIYFPQGRINFSYSGIAREDIKHSATQADYRLMGFNVYNLQDSDPVCRVAFDNDDYFESDLPASNFPSEYLYLAKRLKLNEVRVNNKKYTFTYNTNKLPLKNSYQRDYWGFYNGADENDNYRTAYYNYGFLAPGNSRFIWRGVPEGILDLSDGEQYNDGVVRGFANREPNSDFIESCMLTSITYPTGVLFELFYEMNKYEPLEEFGLENGEDDGSPSIGGGLRIKSISSISESVSQVKFFEYTGGKLLTPMCFVKNPPITVRHPYSGCTTMDIDANPVVLISGNSRVQNGMYTKGGMVGYQNVETINTKYRGISREVIHRDRQISTYYLEYPEQGLNSGENTYIAPYCALEYRPKSAPVNYDILTGTIQRKELYKYDETFTNYHMEKSYTYEHDYNHVKDIWGMGSERISYTHVLNSSDPAYAMGYLYKIKCARSYLTTIIEEDYDESENVINTIEKSYTYDPDTYLKTTEQFNTFDASDWNNKEFHYWYPSDFTEESAVYQQMAYNGILSPIIATVEFSDNNFISKEENIYHKYRPDTRIFYNIKEKRVYGKYIGISMSLYKNANYDKMGKLTEYTNKQDLTRSFIYGYDNNVLIAEFADAEDDEIGYCGFESGDCIDGTALYINNYWAMYCDMDKSSIIPSNNNSTINAVGNFTTNYFASLYSHTGIFSRCIRGEYGPTKSFVPTHQNDRYIFSGWFKSNGGESGLGANIVDAETGEYLDTWSSRFTTSGSDWEYHQMVIDLSRYSGTVKIICFPWNHSHNQTDSPVSMYVDDILFRPERSTYSFYTYKPLVGVTSKTNTNRITEYFEYDEYGRLIEHKDDDKNILKKAEYHYYNE